MRDLGLLGQAGPVLRLVDRDRDDAVLLLHLQRLPALDFQPLDLLLALDIFGVDREFVPDARALDRFLRSDLRLLDLALALGLLLRDFGPLLRAAHGDFALLLEARVFAFLLDRQRQLLGLQVLGADGDDRILLDVVALLLARLDFLGQARHAFGVERVRRVEQLDVGLVEIGQRRRSRVRGRWRSASRRPAP